MNSFIGWIGGKKLLRNEIIKRFPQGFDRYIEVFGGAGWVLFGCERHAQMEIYNDMNSDLVNLFLCVKNNCNELQHELEFILNSRELFELHKYEIMRSTLNNIQRAARFFFLTSYSYGNNTREFCCKSKGIIKPVEYLKLVQKRLNMVVIENKSYDNLIKLYDRTSALFYLDPPYFGTEKLYNRCSFTSDDHEKLHFTLQGLKGKFILSYNDCDMVHTLYKGFNIEEVARSNNLASRYGDKKLYREVLIKNF